MAWLPAPIIPKKMWLPVVHKEKRAITAAEHQKILNAEKNPELRAFYEMCWLIGASQSDVAKLEAAAVDWENRIITHWRIKLKGKAKFPARLKFGDRTATLLQCLPKAGLLFPRIATIHERHRAAEFYRRCKKLKISGISLHSYRYAWAERAKQAGYPERFALEALGHNSKAVHRSYARNADPLLPSLEDYEKKIVPLPANEFIAQNYVG
jgi:integrase